MPSINMSIQCIIIPIADTNISGIENFKIFVLNGVDIIFLISSVIKFFKKDNIKIMPINADKKVGIRIANFAPNIR